MAVRQHATSLPAACVYYGSLLRHLECGRHPETGLICHCVCCAISCASSFKAHSCNYHNKCVQYAVSTKKNPWTSGRRRTARTPANIALNVRQALLSNPNMTASEPILLQQDNQVGLLNVDYPRRLQYLRWLTGQQIRFRRDILICDEATFPMVSTFHPSGQALCPKGKPLHSWREQKQNREKLLVWAGKIRDGTLVGPIFIDRNLNADRNLYLINDDVVPAVLQHDTQPDTWL